LASDLSSTVHKSFPFTEISQAFDALKEPATAGKVLLTMR